MPLDSSLIANALIAKLGSDATLLGFVPNGVYEDEAQSGCTRFVIVSQIMATDTVLFAEGRAIEDALFLIEARVLSTAGTADAAAKAAFRIDELLEDGVLDIPGYQVMEMTREEFVRGLEVDDVDPTIKWRRRGGRYRIRMTHTFTGQRA